MPKDAPLNSSPPGLLPGSQEMGLLWAVWGEEAPANCHTAHRGIPPAVVSLKAEIYSAVARRWSRVASTRSSTSLGRGM